MRNMKKLAINRCSAVLLAAFVWALLIPGMLIAGPAAPDPSSEHRFKLPKYEKFTLKNGLTVYLMEQHEVPLINVSAVFPGGVVKDNGKGGLASLTADGLLFGTKNYTKKQIEEELDFLGARYGASASRESAEVSMTFINTDREKVFPILNEIIRYPSFDQTEFDKHKKRLLLRLEQAKERPRAVIYSYYIRFLFGDHVYGNSVSGSPKSVGGLTVKDLKAFYKSNYKPGESAIAIVGDFKTADMKKRITKLLGDWNSPGASAPVKSSALPTFTKNRILLVNKDDSRQTTFMIGGLGVKENNPDFVAIHVINTIFGQRFTSWLNDELRVNAGLTYGARSRFFSYKDSGVFFIQSYTRTATTVQCIDLALKVLDRLHSKGIDQKTLDSSKNYVKGQFPPDYERSSSLADFLTDMFLYGYNESYINDFEEKVNEMTLEKAKKIIAKYFPKDKLQFVLVGKASEIKDKVKKYGEMTEKEIKADGF